MSAGKAVKQGWAMWFVGIPGSGKSSIASGFVKNLAGRGQEPVFLQMDERRRVYFPDPQYTREERLAAYELFAHEAIENVGKGYNVVMDGCAPVLDMRRYARERIRHFAEIYVFCPLDLAIQRESRREKGQVMAELYAKALERKQTGRQFAGLGEVVGVDVPFEEDPQAELKIDNTDISLQEAVGEVSVFFDRWSRVFS